MDVFRTADEVIISSQSVISLLRHGSEGDVFTQELSYVVLQSLFKKKIKGFKFSSNVTSPCLFTVEPCSTYALVESKSSKHCLI